MDEFLYIKLPPPPAGAHWQWADDTLIVRALKAAHFDGEEPLKENGVLRAVLSYQLYKNREVVLAECPSGIEDSPRKNLLIIFWRYFSEEREPFKLPEELKSKVLLEKRLNIKQANSEVLKLYECIPHPENALMTVFMSGEERTKCSLCGDLLTPEEVAKIFGPIGETQL